MAKRRKEGAEAEEPLDFQIPKFDDEAFIKRERRNIKTMFIAFLFGMLLAGICFGFWVLLEGSSSAGSWCCLSLSSTPYGYDTCS